MLPALLAQVGLPFLLSMVKGGLSKVDHPAATVAAEALGEVGSAVERKEISPEALSAANRHVEAMAQQQEESYRHALTQVNETMRTEARSEDAFTRRWRPFFGYVVALAWGAQIFAISYAVIRTPGLVPEMVNSFASLSVIWGVALSVLGVSVVKRSQDKKVAKGQSSEVGSGLAGAFGSLLGRRSGS